MEPNWNSDKPFAGPDDPATATCWDCGYTWRRGQDGSHSCVAGLKRRAAEMADRAGFLATQHADFRNIITDREMEIRLLRRERRLLVDLDIVKSNVIAGLLSGEVRQSHLNEIERLQKEVLRLHTDARAGVLLPEGVSCGCLLCAPKRDLQPLKVEGQDAPLIQAGPREPEKEN